MSISSFVLGVDGGGTKTVAWLAPRDSGEILGRGSAGPGNPRAAGFDVALENIDAAIIAAFADANLPRAEAAAACFGLAGAGRATEQQQIEDWASSRGIARRVQVTGDAEPILAAACPDNIGVALICGTGSLAWGRNAAGETARCGGWGYLLGDEGSGYAIALAGLRAAMRAADGRGPDTSLLPALKQELAAVSTDELIAKIYGQEMIRERLARLAGVVFDLQATDATAKLILSVGASQLAEMVLAVAAQLQLPDGGYTLALAGGVFVNRPDYVSQLMAAMNGEAAQARRRPVSLSIVEQPVQGAVALAQLLCA